jgi:hypothetical protein
MSKWTLDSPLSTLNTTWKKNLSSNLEPPNLTPKTEKEKNQGTLGRYCTSHSLDEIFLLKRVHRNEHPKYIGEKGGILGKTYGFEIKCYWEHP